MRARQVVDRADRAHPRSASSARGPPATSVAPGLTDDSSALSEGVSIARSPPPNVVRRRYASSRSARCQKRAAGAAVCLRHCAVRNSSRMASRALMTSSFEAAFLLKLRRRLNCLLGRSEVEDERLRPAGLGLLRFRARSCSRVAPPWVAIFSTSAVIFSGSACRATCRRLDLLPMSASRQSFRTSAGMALSDNVSVIDVRDLPRRLAMSSWV